MGKTGPLFAFNAYEDVRLRHDAAIEKVEAGFLFYPLYSDVLISFFHVFMVELNHLDFICFVNNLLLYLHWFFLARMNPMCW